MENKKTLWIVTELFPPDETSTSYILGEIANAMVAKYRVKVICGPEIYDKRKKLDKNNQFSLDPSIEVFRVKGLDVDKNTKIGKAVGLLSMSLRLLKVAKRNIKKDDKVLLVTNPLPLILLISRLKLKVGFELSLLVHDIFPENAKPSNIYVPFEPLIKKLFDRAYSRADMLIALGRDMKEVLMQKINSIKSSSVNKPQIVVIENWADIKNIFPQKHKTCNSIIIEYAGNIGRGQGLPIFLDNFIRAKNSHLAFTLYGTGASEEPLKQMVAENQLSNVVFNGSYFRSQQNEVLNACHLALVTLADGMYGLGVPSKSYNIMAAGKPILFIGNLKSEIALTVSESNIGFCFDSKDTEGLIAFLKQLSLDMLPQLEEMGARARELAVSKYSEESILHKFQITL